jgi:predicted amidohydrolase
LNSTKSTVVACCQLAPKIGDLAYNRKLTERAIRSAAFQGAHVVVLPELIQSGYLFSDRSEALSLAETAEGPTLRLWMALARELNIVVVGGFCERLADDVLANSAAMIDAQGLRAVYRKAHLWDGEKEIFSAGNDAPPVVETVHGRIGMLICYDLEFPEWVRLPALAGADLLCAPVNWPDGPRPQTERPAEVVRVQANASVNRIFIAACDRHGHERGVSWVQGSVIVDADGYPVAGPAEQGGEQILLATLNLAEARNKRISARNDLHRDRRSQLYGLNSVVERSRDTHHL